jgi:mannose-6-phosphate isomerase-like protein (cupin superfamily)
MRIERTSTAQEKGWYAGPWNSELPLSIGYAFTGVDEPHVHSIITEIYLISRGTSRLRVERETIRLSAGDIFIVEPGEAHTFLDNSPDYFHFVLHTPGLAGEEARSEKKIVLRERLGLI